MAQGRVGHCVAVGRRSLQRIGVGLLLSTMFVSCRSSTTTPRLSSGLVGASDLPGRWGPFKAGPASTIDLCGRQLGPQQRVHATASIAWAVTPENAPIFGERLDQYPDRATAAKALAIAKTLPLPCEFTRADGTRWRTEWLRSPSVGADGRVFLVTSRDRPDAFNYEVVALSGDTLLRAVLNTRRPDRALLDRLVGIAWATARRGTGLGA